MNYLELVAEIQRSIVPPAEVRIDPVTHDSYLAYVGAGDLQDELNELRRGQLGRIKGMTFYESSGGTMSSKKAKKLLKRIRTTKAKRGPPGPAGVAHAGVNIGARAVGSVVEKGPLIYPSPPDTSGLGVPDTTHELKCWPMYFDDLAEGRKKFEVRQNDRAFRIGEVIVFHEYAPRPAAPGRIYSDNHPLGRYTGRQCTRRITYVFGDHVGLRGSYVVLGLAPLDA